MKVFLPKEIALLSVLFAAALGSSTSTAANITGPDLTALQTLQQIQTVFVIALENHNFSQIQGNAAAPYVNSLITPGHSNAVQVAYATKYYNAGLNVHPSEPSYVWAEAGTDFGVHTDADPGTGNTFTAPHFTAQLNAAGIPWRNYQEDLQYSAGATHSASGAGVAVNPYNHSTSYDYAVKHNPMAFFSDTHLQNVHPLTNFLNHLTNNAIGRYNWITPDQFNDMHSSLGSFTYHGTTYTGDQAAIAEGDNFLSILVPQIMASPAYRSNGVIVLWWDETEGGDGTGFTIPEIIISPLARGNAYASSVEYNHSSDLKTMEEIFGLPFLTNAIPAGEKNASGSGHNNVTNVNDLSDMFQPFSAPAITVPADIIVEATNAAGNIVSFTVTASDATDGALIPVVAPPGGSLFPPGTNTVTATATNSHGLSATSSFLVIVRDTRPPVITLNGANPFTNFLGVAFADPGATASDLISGAVALTANGTVDVNTVGNYSINYIASDAAGNVATNTRAVQVIAPPPPTGFNGVVSSDGGGFQLSFSGAVGQPYRVLGTDDLTQPVTNWIVLTSGMVSNNPVVFTDPTITNAGRFYLIISP